MSISEENKVGDNGQKKPEEIKEFKMVIVKKFEGETGLTVEGPGNGKYFDEPICFWLLEKAKDYIKRHNQMEGQSKVIQGNKMGQMMQYARRGFRR
ncbi:MAG TPA: hypothetical protein ENH85_09825 [Candidatus Scalindua sp.]|nr:hypothetical protein [Candidatus Scalindua sp.]